MSTPTTGASSAANASPAAVGRNAPSGTAGANGHRPGAGGPALLFANLLHLLGSAETPATAGEDTSTGLLGIDLDDGLPPSITGDLTPADAAAQTAQPETGNPLSAVLAWTTPANPWPPQTISRASVTEEAPGSGPRADKLAQALVTEGPDDAAPTQATSAADHLPATSTPTPASASATSLPPGLVALGQPVPADARLTAAAEQARAARPADAPTPEPASTTHDRTDPNRSAADASAPLAAAPAGARRATSPSWRSTTTLGAAAASRSTALPHPPAQAALSATPPGRADAIGVGSRPAASTPSADGLWLATGVQDAALGEVTTGHGASTGNGGQSPGGSGTGFATAAPAGRSDATPSTEAPRFSTEQAEAERAEHPASPAPQQLKQVNVRVGDTAEEAIDIRLALEGDSLQVDFRTDSAETRSQLQQSAAGSLGDLLQRGGLQLGGVSVGAHGAGQDPQPSHAPSPQRSATRAPLSGAAEPVSGTTARPTVQSPRQDGSQPLDLFV